MRMRTDINQYGVAFNFTTLKLVGQNRGQRSITREDISIDSINLSEAKQRGEDESFSESKVTHHKQVTLTQKHLTLAFTLATSGIRGCDKGQVAIAMRITSQPIDEKFVIGIEAERRVEWMFKIEITSDKPCLLTDGFSEEFVSGI